VVGAARKRVKKGGKGKIFGGEVENWEHEKKYATPLVKFPFSPRMGLHKNLLFFKFERA
jgi:hypothetical protein